MTHNKSAPLPRSYIQEQLVNIPSGKEMLEGILTIPENARGIVIFSHGSGSSRHSPRNRYVADVLNRRDVATLLIDLLSKEEEVAEADTRHLRFNIPMLADRLITIADWVMRYAQTRKLKVGYFGSSTGGAAAIMAAAMRPENIGAVISRGGRPDLAETYLPFVEAPTLLIVGEKDTQVLEFNQDALKHLNAYSKLNIIPEATHLFEESGTLEEVSFLAADWFKKLLR